MDPTKTQNRKQFYKKVNHFDRIKGKTIPFNISKPKNAIYFDTETFEYYETVETKQPKIIPYLIGVIDSDTKNFKYFLGIDSSLNFFNYVFGHKDLQVSLKHICNDAELVAFNIDYDFHAIRPWIEDEYPNEIYISYMMTDDKKFICGSLSNKKENTGPLAKIRLRLIDLWLWDRNQSLATSINAVKELTWDDKGRLKIGTAPERLNKVILDYGLNIKKLSKLTIDYKKINLHKKGNKYYYWSSKEDWISGNEPKELDVKGELKYLEIDVRSLPVIYEMQNLFREEMKKALKIDKTFDKDKSITLPGYCKYLYEEFYKRYMTQDLRCAISLNTYNDMERCYIGAFTASNKDLLYIDETKFKEMYPDKSFYDNQQRPIIRSYDVNSMYPYIINDRLPYGPPLNEVGNMSWYVTWYEIKFNDYVDLEKKIIYKWKKKYDCFNNSFFGENFNPVVDPGGRANKVYILKELYELFLEMCDSFSEVVNKRYQPVIYGGGFVEKLYGIKANYEKGYTEFQVKGCKLALNSLYGKFAERYKEYNIQWTNNIQQFKEEILSRITADSINQEDLTTYVNDIEERIHYENKGSALVLKENTSRRFNKSGQEVRENIAAGLYITQKARWILLSAIKGEIDGGNVILNCDTDSIKMIQFKEPQFYIHPKELGAWKAEKIFTHFGHPNMLKKYWCANEQTKELEIKCAGIPLNKLHDITKYSFQNSIEALKIIYNPQNRIVIRDAKRINYRNDWFQIVIDKTDIEFIRNRSKEPYTHEIVDGILKWLTK